MLAKIIHFKCVFFFFSAEEIKEHNFFAGIDWHQVYIQKYTPPLIPPRGEVNAADAFDIGSFDEEDTKGIKLTDADVDMYRFFPLTISERYALLCGFTGSTEKCLLLYQYIYGTFYTPSNQVAAGGGRNRFRNGQRRGGQVRAEAEKQTKTAIRCRRKGFGLHTPRLHQEAGRFVCFGVADAIRQIVPK